MIAMLSKLSARPFLCDVQKMGGTSKLFLACALGVCLFVPSFRAQSAVPAQPVYPVTQAPPPAPLKPLPAVTPVTSNPAPPPSASVEPGATELETLVRPIALHPDPLIAVILPAAVYPLEVVQAARFVRDTNNLAKMDQQPWDDKVKAAAKFPELIAMLNEDLAWTTQLGQAFLNQPMDPPTISTGRGSRPLIVFLPSMAHETSIREAGEALFVAWTFL